MDQELKEVLQAINERFDKMDERFDRMDERFDKMDERFDRLENDVTSIKHTLENDILLTLQNTISVCQDTNRKLDAYLEKND